MQALINAITQSVLTRFLANIFLFLLVLSALTVAGYEILSGQPINSLVQNLLLLAAGYAVTILGINHGSTMTPTAPLDASTAYINTSTITPPITAPTTL